MWHMTNGWGWWMFFGTLMMAVFWIAVIYAVIWLGRRPSDERQQPPRSEEPTPLQILERRYASGELSDEEFETKKHKLTA